MEMSNFKSNIPLQWYDDSCATINNSLLIFKCNFSQFSLLRYMHRLWRVKSFLLSCMPVAYNPRHYQLKLFIILIFDVICTQNVLKAPLYWGKRFCK